MALVLTPVTATAYGYGVDIDPEFDDISIGTAFADRMVLCCFNSPATFVTITGVTFNGNAATIQAYAGSGGSVGSFSGQIVWAWLNVPTGTTMDVNVTWSGDPNGSGDLSIVVYTFDQTQAAASPTYSSNNATGSTDNTVTLDTSANGFIITSSEYDYFIGQTTLVINSATETYTSDYSSIAVGVGAHRRVSSLVSGSAASSPTSVTYRASLSAQSLASILAWAPAAAVGGAVPMGQIIL